MALSGRSGFLYPLGQLLGLRYKLRLGLLDAVEVAQAERGQTGEHQRADDHGHHRQGQASAHR